MNPDPDLKSEISDLKSFSADHLREFCARVFVHHGVPPPDAAKAADVLVTSDLRGIDSHGVARLNSYHDFLSDGRINAPEHSDCAQKPQYRHGRWR